MGVYLELMNFNDMFYKQSTKEPIIVNDFKETTEEDKESLNNLIYTKYHTDLLSNLPTCECGEIVGEYNVGVTCKNCNSVVRSVMDQSLEPIVWIRSPIGVRQLINPMVWTMLTKKFTVSNFQILRWICDTTYSPQIKTPPIMEAVYSLGIDRGYNNFVDNFEDITSSLFRLRATKGVEDPLQILLRTQRECVFSDYLPLPNRSLLVLEETNVGVYVDPIVTGAVDAIRTMVGLDTVLNTHNLRTKENRTIKTIAQLSEFYKDVWKTTLAKKEGIFRKHIFGTRSHFSARAVISSLTDKHNYDELHIPWGIGVSMLRIHLMNKLFRIGFTPNEAIAFLNEHAQKYHPLLDELFKLLISEAPGGRLSCVFQREYCAI